jgi:hypothetical protein
MSEKLSSKFGNEEKPVNKTGLPLDYGDTKITILPRDPICIFAYWSISGEFLDKLKKQYGEQNFENSKLVVRVYDTTDINFDGSNANRYFDVFVTPESSSWYINVGEFNRCWCADIGYLTQDGKFIYIARSNKIDMPRYGVSNITDEQWAMLQVEFEKLLRISGVNKIGMSSFDIAKLMRERWEEIVSISLPSSHSHIGSSSFKTNTYYNQNEQPLHDKVKSFWLRADTEIVINGATEPDATLTLKGQPIKLSADGSFSVRFYLPNGEDKYTIEAVSSDGTMKKSITFEVKKDTK